LPEALLESPTRIYPRRDSKQWIPALVWIAVIAFESTDSMSAAHTGSMLANVVTRVFGQVDPVLVDTLNHALRKVGHVVGYAILSWLLFRAWRATLPSAMGRGWAFPWARLAFWMSAAIATLDEFHQSFIPSRTGRWQDVVLDGAAALLMQIFLFLFFRFKHPRAKSPT
jgi:VanZ family protein